jgi:hypothetical protein
MYLDRATSSRGSRASSRSTPALSPPRLNSATQYLPCSTAFLTQRSASKTFDDRLNDCGALPLTQVKCAGTPRPIGALGEQDRQTVVADPHSMPPMSLESPRRVAVISLFPGGLPIAPEGEAPEVENTTSLRCS